jgi:hypothetical protein
VRVVVKKVELCCVWANGDGAQSMGPKSRPKRSAADAAPYCPSRAERFFVAADPARTRRWHQEHDDHSYDLPADSTPLQRIQWRRFARRPEEGLRTAPSTIPNGGIGLFTDVLIYRGEIVSEYTGRRLSDEEYYARYAGKQPPEYCVGLGPHISIDLFFLSNGLCFGSAYLTHFSFCKETRPKSESHSICLRASFSSIPCHAVFIFSRVPTDKNPTTEETIPTTAQRERAQFEGKENAKS